MKKLLLLLALPLVFAACNKEKGDFGDYPSLILGTWLVNDVDINLEAPTLPAEAKTALNELITGEMDYDGATMEFKTNNIVTDSDGDGNYYISGNKLTIVPGGGSVDDEEAMPFTIKTLNKSELVIVLDVLPMLSAMADDEDFAEIAPFIDKFEITMTGSRQ